MEFASRTISPVPDISLLNRRRLRGVTRYLVRWRGHTSAYDEWLREEELVHCREKVAEYDAPAPRRLRVGAVASRRRAAAAAVAAAAAACRAAAGGPSGRLAAADSDYGRGGNRPRLSGQDGAVLLARRWLGSWTLA